MINESLYLTVSNNYYEMYIKNTDEIELPIPFAYSSNFASVVLNIISGIGCPSFALHADIVSITCYNRNSRSEICSIKLRKFENSVVHMPHYGVLNFPDSVFWQ